MYFLDIISFNSELLLMNWLVIDDYFLFTIFLFYLLNIVYVSYFITYISVFLLMKSNMSLYPNLPKSITRLHCFNYWIKSSKVILVLILTISVILSINLISIASFIVPFSLSNYSLSSVNEWVLIEWTINSYIKWNGNPLIYSIYVDWINNVNPYFPPFIFLLFSMHLSRN